MKKYRKIMSYDTEEWSKEELILENFLWDAIDFKQSVEGTLKV